MLPALVYATILSLTYCSPTHTHSAKVEIKSRGTRSLGYGFVTYENEEDAAKAVATLSKRIVQGREINVEGAKPQEELDAAREAKSAARKAAKDAKAAERKQQQEAKAAAAAANGETPAESAKKQSKPRAPRARNTRRPRADDGEEADNVAADGEAAAGEGAASSTTSKRNKKSRAKKAAAANGEAPAGEGAKPARQPRGPKGAPEGEPSKTLVFAANLSYDVDDAALKEAFEGLSVSSAKVVRRQFGAKRSKGYGFVDFASEQDQQKALSDFNGKDWKGRPLSLKIAIQGSKEQADKEAKDEAVAATTTQAPSAEAA